MFDSLISKNDKQIFKNGKYTIAFEYSALCLKNSEEVYFKYMLEGRDNKWCEPTKSRVVEFSNLTEGEYTFKVIAYNGDGFSAKEITTFTFIIDKPIWKNAWFWLIVLVLLILLVLFIVRVRTASLIKAKMRLEKTVEEKTSELRHEKELVEAKNSIIEAQNKDITSSITYAKRIQEAILPDKNLDENIKNKILVYYKPKDIVSGDFYWFAEKNNRFLLAAFDCTGHGVPGAFMSMIGTTLLNKIVFDNNENDPSKILLEMDKEISKSLRQENSEVNDGMEAGLCSIDLNAKEVLYSGAKRALFHFKKTIAGYSLEEYKADKFPIGGFADVKNKQFTTHQITGTSGDMIYMFSDGIIDQFNDQRKRISTKGLRELLSTIVHLDVNEQWDYIDAFLLDWKGATKQTDDILLLGIRL
jgi:serine phosphatase RsbU (regulator of sigma subunit)